MNRIETFPPAAGATLNVQYIEKAPECFGSWEALRIVITANITNNTGGAINVTPLELLHLFRGQFVEHGGHDFLMNSRLSTAAQVMEALTGFTIGNAPVAIANGNAANVTATMFLTPVWPVRSEELAGEASRPAAWLERLQIQNVENMDAIHGAGATITANTVAIDAQLVCDELETRAGPAWCIREFIHPTQQEYNRMPKGRFPVLLANPVGLAAAALPAQFVELSKGGVSLVKNLPTAVYRDCAFVSGARSWGDPENAVALSEVIAQEDWGWKYSDLKDGAYKFRWGAAPAADFIIGVLEVKAGGLVPAISAVTGIDDELAIAEIVALVGSNVPLAQAMDAESAIRVLRDGVVPLKILKRIRKPRAARTRHVAAMVAERSRIIAPKLGRTEG